MQNNKAFTLIELLIVISIIGVLATIFVNVSSLSTKKARDSARKSDLKQYQNALELFANKTNGFYTSRLGSGSGVNASSSVCTDLGMTGCPEDPNNTKDATFVYKYVSDGSGNGTIDATKYVLWAKLEAVSPVTYWVYCSNGKAGQTSSGIPAASGVCPLP